MELADSCNGVTLYLCIYIMINKTIFSLPRNSNKYLHFFIKATSSLVASGGMMLLVNVAMETSVFGKTGHEVPTDLVHTNSSYLSVPTSMFEGILHFNPDSRRFIAYAACTIAFVYWDILSKTQITGMFPPLNKPTLNSLIPLATTIIPRNENEEARKNEIVQSMLSKVHYLRKDIVYFVIVEFAFFLLAAIGSLVNPVKLLLSHNSLVRLTGSEWAGVCESHTTSQDSYFPTKCQHYSNGDKISKICILANNKTFFYLQFISWYLLSLLAIFCAVVFLRNLHGIFKFGLLRMADNSLIRFLKQNAGYRRHKAIIDLFAEKLEERTRKLMEEKDLSLKIEEEIELTLASLEQCAPTIDGNFPFFPLAARNSKED